jgi:hypothetical protein
MKKSILLFLSICLFFGNPANAQLSRYVNKVTNNVLNKPETASSTQKQQPEPKCACDQPDLILDLSGKLKVDYTEISISMMADGSILVKDRMSGKYYIAKDGVSKGPYSEGDPEVTAYTNSPEADNDKSPLVKKYKDYITQTGDKYLITFSGKKYGPYGQITSFVVTKSKDKFAATVIENVVATEDQGKKMEEAIKNAKTDQERMELAMKYSQEMQQKMMAGGGPTSILPKFITNVAGATYDPATGGFFNGNMKYDDILVTMQDGSITDLKGNKVVTIKPEHAVSDKLFVNTTNTKYAVEGYGTLTFSDNTTLSDLFNTRLIKVDGKVYVAYMYYSPKRNAIMQCKMLF